MSFNPNYKLPNDLDDEIISTGGDGNFAPLENGPQLCRLVEYGPKQESSFTAKRPDGTEYKPPTRKFFWEPTDHPGRRESEFVRTDTLNEKSTFFDIFKAIYGHPPDPKKNYKSSELLPDMLGKFALLNMEQKMGDDGRPNGFMKITAHMSAPKSMIPKESPAPDVTPAPTAARPEPWRPAQPATVGTQAEEEELPF